jgi:hypothetical protein
MCNLKELLETKFEIRGRLVTVFETMESEELEELELIMYWYLG